LAKLHNHQSQYFSDGKFERYNSAKSKMSSDPFQNIIKKKPEPEPQGFSSAFTTPPANHPMSSAFHAQINSNQGFSIQPTNQPDTRMSSAFSASNIQPPNIQQQQSQSTLKTSSDVVGAKIDKVTRALGIEGLGASDYAAAAGLADTGVVAGALGAAGAKIGMEVASKAVTAAQLLKRINPVSKQQAAIAMQKGGTSSLSKLFSIGQSGDKIITTTNLNTGSVRQVQINTKTVGIMNNLLPKFFSNKALAAAGAWAGAVGLGLWGAAESKDPMSAVRTSLLIPNAKLTGDWSLVDESYEIDKELSDFNTWEKIGLFSPLSPAIGIPRKMKGIAEAVKISQAVTDDIKIQMETGETDEEKWARIKQEQADQEKANVDYYNAERKKLLEWELEAKAAARDADAAFWAKEGEKTRKAELENQRAIVEFWLEYKRKAQEMSKDSTPSNLKFGLL
jgi:hypothetical protein